MENLFEEKKWNRDNVKLYKGMLFVNLSGERWVLLDDSINRISILLGSEKLATQCDDGTFYYTIEDDNILVRSKEDSDYKRTITYYELFEITYSDWWNSDLEVSHKQLANALNVATLYNERPIVNLFNNRLWNISNNVVVVEGIMFINVTGDRWYPIADNVSGGFSHNPGEFVFTPNDCGLTKLISVNTKYKTLDIFSLFFNAERNHEYSITQPLLVKLGQDVVKGKNWKDYHDLLLEELNRYNPSVRLFANDKVEYESYEDDWGEPEEEEETVEFHTEYINIFDDGIEGVLTPKGSGRKWWNKFRKDILGIKTPSERFEESMKDFGITKEEALESVKVFHNNLHEALKAHLNHDLIKDHLEKKEKSKTLNDIRKEHGFPEVETRPLEDKDVYSWLAHIDDDGNLKFDKVNSPDHYKLRGLDIEAIDVIRGALDEDEFRGFCKGNVLKYTIREAHKNGDEDLKKAKKYLDFLEKDDSDE
nr:MAG TPA: nucelotide kinase [Caudoviricetes sp.]